MMRFFYISFAVVSRSTYQEFAMQIKKFDELLHHDIVTNYALVRLPLRICCKIDLIVGEERKTDP